MEHEEALIKATEIARSAFIQAQHDNVEQNVRLAEQSPSPVLRSLARAYRMMQRPF